MSEAPDLLVSEIAHDTEVFNYPFPDSDGKNTYYTSILGYDNGTGYYVDPREIHQEFDNRFVGTSHFEHNDTYTYRHGTETYELNPATEETYYHFNIEEGNQNHTTFTQFEPNQTSDNTLEETYTLSLSASFGVSNFGIGVGISKNDPDQIIFTSYDSLEYNIPPDGGVGAGILPTDEDRLYGFETDIDSDLPDDDKVTMSLDSEFEYTAGVLQRYRVTPQAKASVTLTVTDENI